MAYLARELCKLLDLVIHIFLPVITVGKEITMINRGERHNRVDLDFGASPLGPLSDLEYIAGVGRGGSVSRTTPLMLVPYQTNHRK